MNQSQEEFNQPDGEPIPKLKKELAEVRRALMETVQQLIDRGQRLEELVRKTQSLEITVRLTKLKVLVHFRRPKIRQF